MKYSVTTSVEKIQSLFSDEDYRIIIEQGGTSAGKTISTLWVLLDYALTNGNKIISIVSDTFPNLRKGAMRDFLDICRETDVLEIATWNKAESTLLLPNGTIIEFFSCDMMGALGARRDVLYINEANRISWDTFSQLEIRTREKIIIDFNPVNKFWAHTELIEKKRKDVAFVKLTFEDNEALDENTYNAILARKGDGTSNWWRVYGLGEIGSLEGNVYEGWTPAEAQWIEDNGIRLRYGLDFGFANDQTGMLDIYQMKDEPNAIGVIERLYETGILGSQYAQKFEIIGVDPSTLITADGARPEIIAEIRQSGYRCIAADKGPGSVKRGIDRVQAKKIYYCGKNLEHEYLTYAWRKKKSTGEVLDEPQDGNDHLMDALRYAIDDLARPKFDF